MKEAPACLKQMHPDQIHALGCVAAAEESNIYCSCDAAMPQDSVHYTLARLTAMNSKMRGQNDKGLLGQCGTRILLMASESRRLHCPMRLGARGGLLIRYKSPDAEVVGCDLPTSDRPRGAA